MEEHRLSVRSITYAIKAQKLLERHRIPCRIVRNRSNPKGCGYLLLVRGDVDRILRLLSQNGIPVRKEPQS